MKKLVWILFAVFLMSAAAAVSAEEAEVYKNTLKWSTASEMSNFGFDIYRSESEDGPFERVTDAPIEGAGTTDLIHRYQFVDDQIDPYTTYYYYIESISEDGKRKRFSPIRKAKAKLPKETG